MSHKPNGDISVPNEIIHDLTDYFVKRQLLEAFDTKKEIYALKYNNNFKYSGIKSVYTHYKKTKSPHLKNFITNVLNQNGLSYMTLYQLFKKEAVDKDIALTLIKLFHEEGLASMVLNNGDNVIYKDSILLLKKHSLLSEETLFDRLSIATTNTFINEHKFLFSKKMF